MWDAVVRDAVVGECEMPWEVSFGWCKEKNGMNE